MAEIAPKWRLKSWRGISQWSKMEEFEIKFLEVDVPELEKKLLAIGAEKVGEYDYKITLFDYPDLRMDKNNSWLKLRTDGKETTLSYKERIGVNSSDASIPDDGMKEIEVVVDSYKKTYELLLATNFIIKRKDEKRRIRYKKDEAVFDIDFWPELPPFLEVESVSMEKAGEAAQELGFDPEKGLVCSAGQIYKNYGYNLSEYSALTFNGMIKK